MIGNFKIRIKTLYNFKKNILSLISRGSAVQEIPLSTLARVPSDGTAISINESQILLSIFNFSLKIRKTYIRLGFNFRRCQRKVWDFY